MKETARRSGGTLCSSRKSWDTCARLHSEPCRHCSIIPQALLSSLLFNPTSQEDSEVPAHPFPVLHLRYIPRVFTRQTNKSSLVPGWDILMPLHSSAQAECQLLRLESVFKCGTQVVVTQKLPGKRTLWAEIKGGCAVTGSSCLEEAQDMLCPCAKGYGCAWAAESTQRSALLVPKGPRGLVTSPKLHCGLALRVFLESTQIPQVPTIPNATNTHGTAGFPLHSHLSRGSASTSSTHS